MLEAATRSPAAPQSEALASAKAVLRAFSKAVNLGSVCTLGCLRVLAQRHPEVTQGGPGQATTLILLGSPVSPAPAMCRREGEKGLMSEQGAGWMSQKAGAGWLHSPPKSMLVRCLGRLVFRSHPGIHPGFHQGLCL